VAQLALARCEVAIDGGLHQRVHEPERRLWTHDLGANELPACRGDGFAVETGERTDSGRLCTVSEDRSGAPRPPRRAEAARRRSTARETARGPSSAMTPTCARRVAPLHVQRLESSLRSRGLPSVEAWHASAKAGSTPSPSRSRAAPPWRRHGWSRCKPLCERVAVSSARRAASAPGSDGRRPRPRPGGLETSVR
jgi:hypothetical protein